MFVSPRKALEPCRVTMLKTAPATLPYSALAPSDRDCTSSIASVLGHGHAAPDSGAVKSVPSSRYRFSLAAEPKAFERELV